MSNAHGGGEREFRPVSIAVLTVSDSRDEQSDKSGRLLVERLTAAGHRLAEERIGPDGKTYAAMPMAGAEPNYFTINGKSFPDTEKIQVKRGEVVRLRLENVGQLTHPMHLHGAFFRIVATDGNPVPEGAQLTKDTLAVNPGERYDIEFVADNPGTWVLHCHVLHHVTNDNVEPGGLITVIEVS